ncbi:MAG: HRDC domain-containing protein [Myxococcota bacterium]
MDYRIVTLRMGEDGRFDDAPLKDVTRTGALAHVEVVPTGGAEGPLLALVFAVERGEERAPALGTDALRERLAEPDRPVFDALRAWRRERAAEDAVPAYVVLGNRALATLAATRPRDADGLLAVPGIGAVKLARYGDDLLALLGAAEEGGDEDAA